MMVPRKRFSVSLALALSALFFLLYLASFELNTWLFSEEVYAQGVAWVFLPAGIKLLAVLVGRWWGLLGVALAGLWVTHSEVWTSGDWLAHVGNISVWLVLPFLVIQPLSRWWQLEPDLSNLNFDRLFLLNAAFTSASAVGTSVYAWWVYERREVDMVASAIVMAVGDFIGTLLVMGAVLVIVIAIEKLKQLRDH